MAWKTLLIFLVYLCTAAAHGARTSTETPYKLSAQEKLRLENLACQGPFGIAAKTIKAYNFTASFDENGQMTLPARTSAYVECEPHNTFNQRPMRYIDDCDLVDNVWDCSVPQLEILVDIKGRDVKLRPWQIPHEKAHDLLKTIGAKGLFQGEALDKAIGNSCDMAKNKDPDIIELQCEATMSISFWCPQAKLTGCPRVLFLSFSEPAWRRKQSAQ
jgi:hypothetical protein